MKFERFEDIEAWQKARLLTALIFNDLKNCNDFAFKNQILRALVSVTNNIAEGFERQSNNEFKRFLFISKSSCGEVRSMFYTALDLKYIEKEKLKKRYDLSIEISRMLSGLIKTL